MCYSKYFKNFILCGEADYHCLLCNETFHKIDDIEKHIRWENHRKVLKMQTCLPKFKNDGVFKIEKYFYCLYCNHVAPNMASVKEHIESNEHTVNKTTPEIIKKIKFDYDSGTVYVNKIKVESHYWHGIHNKRCLLCNAVVENALNHIDTQDHVIKLIQTETKYSGDDMCYRQINETTFQCFTCMKTFSTVDFDNHCQQHEKNNKPVEFKNTNGNDDQQVIIYDIKEFKKFGDEEYDIEKLAEIEDDFYYIDRKNKEIICKQCKVPVRNTQNDLRNHMYKKHDNYDLHKSNIIKQIEEDINKKYLFIYKIDSGKKRHELAVYGKDNHIKLNAGGSKGYCVLCDRFLSAHINIFKQHVGGAIHNGHLEIKGKIKARKHKKALTRTETFVRYLSNMDYIKYFDAVAMNMSFCIDKDSFLLMKRIKHGHYNVTKCFVCDVTFKEWQEKEHCEGKTHKSYVMAAKVVIEKMNFIREIKPKLYHCGICNVSLPFWETLQKHLDDISHKMKIMAKHFVTSMEQFHNEHGNLPEMKEIECSTNSDVLYSNIMKVLYENRLSGIRLYTINLEKLAESKCKGLILL